MLWEFDYFCYDSSFIFVNGRSSCDVLWCCVFVVIMCMFVCFISFCVMFDLVLYMFYGFSICMCSLTSKWCLLICLHLLCFYFLFLSCVQISKTPGSKPWKFFNDSWFVSYSELIWLLEFVNDLEIQRVNLPPGTLLILVDSCCAFIYCL